VNRAPGAEQGEGDSYAKVVGYEDGQDSGWSDVIERPQKKVSGQRNMAVDPGDIVGYT
jgi:hypothetical protein